MEMRTLGQNGPRVSALGLVGMSRRAQNLKAFDVTLTKDDLDRSFALGAITGDRYPAQMKHLTAK
jgi:hypothetical protein